MYHRNRAPSRFEVGARPLQEIMATSALHERPARPDRAEILRAFPDALEVLNMRAATHGKVLTLGGASGETHVEIVSPFTYVFERFSKGNPPGLGRSDFFRLDQQKKLRKICDAADGSLVTAQVRPYFRVHLDLAVSEAFSIPAVCEEVTDDDAFSAVNWLNHFHYRSLNMWGRSTALLLRLEESTHSRPYGSAIGYIMLNSAPLLTKPRDLIVGWDTKQRLAHVDRVVRIARVVVHPEFRGIGAGSALVRAAIKYANEYWNAAAKKPMLLETVAEMSRLHPIFLKGGLLPCGETAGREEVVLTPRDRLDHLMGPGHWKSSLDRMKMKASTPKPYFAIPLRSCPEDIKNSTKSCRDSSPVESETRLTNKLEPPLISLRRVCLVKTAETQSNGERPLHEMLADDQGRLASTIPSVGNGLTCALKAIRQGVEDSNLAVDMACGLDEAVIAAADYEQAVAEAACALDRMSKTISAKRAEINHFLSGVHSASGEVIRVLRAIRSQIETELSALHGKSGHAAAIQSLSSLHSQLSSLEQRLANKYASPREVEIMAAFGLESNTPEQVILQSFSLDILPGSVVLIEGASGSGKTSLLEVLSGHVSVSSGEFLPSDIGLCSASIDLNFSNDRAVIDLLGVDTKHACSLLNAAGISEAKVYLKRRGQLSHGQRYRVAAAVLASSGKSVWIADEFCAFLDSLTACMVANGVASLARSVGATLIVAAADGSRIRDALRPDITVHLVSGAKHSPHPDLRFWKSAADAMQDGRSKRSRKKSASDVLDDLWASDLVFHRLLTERSMSPNATTKDISDRVYASLANLVPEWTDTTLRRQLNLRLRVLSSLCKN